MELQINKIRRDNLEYAKKIRTLKNSQVIQSKELEVCNIHKKYPYQINVYTEEIKNLVAKKHEYFNKICNDKKSVLNLQNYLTKIIKTFTETINKAKYNKTDKNNEAMLKIIEENINFLKEQMIGNDDEILERANTANLQNYPGNNIITPITNILNNNNFLIKGAKSVSSKVQASRSKSPTNKYILPAIVPHRATNIEDNEKELAHFPSTSPKRIYKGIFNKYEYLHSKGRNSLPHYMSIGNNSKDKLGENLRTNKKSSTNKLKSLQHEPIEEISQEQSNLEEAKDDVDFLNIDYENTFDPDYKNLLKKKDQLFRTSLKVEKNVKENEKLYDKKFKDLKNTIEHNQKKLKIMQQVYIYIFYLKIAK